MRVISGISKIDVRSSKRRRLLAVHDTLFFCAHRSAPASALYGCEFPLASIGPVESGYCSDSDGKYIVFGHAVDALCVSKGGLVHEVVFWDDSSEDDLKTDLVVRARKKMERYNPVVDYDYGVDVYYLSTLKPRNLDTGQS